MNQINNLIPLGVPDYTPYKTIKVACITIKNNHYKRIKVAYKIINLIHES
jgi:hypothetical protein